MIVKKSEIPLQILRDQINQNAPKHESRVFIEGYFFGVNIFFQQLDSLSNIFRVTIEISEIDLEDFYFFFNSAISEESYIVPEGERKEFWKGVDQAAEDCEYLTYFAYEVIPVSLIA